MSTHLDLDPAAIARLAMDPADEAESEQQQQRQQQQQPSRKRKHTAEAVDEDVELKRLADANINRPLDELAQIVKVEDSANAQSTASEQSRQVFGTVWLLKTCVVAPYVAIPRNRIYARYAEICAHHKIKPLNPAAFGKLVKLMFPDIKTRRLGVRGKSKYHYCGINVIGETSTITASQAMLEGTPDDMNDMIDEPYPPDEGDQQQQQPEPHDNPEPDPPFDDDIAVPTLHFSKHAPPISFDTFVLPSIDPFVPDGADKDAVDILTALCQSHCSSLVEAIRYMHLKQFLNTLSSFHGTLTTPVQKLLAVPSILEWVAQCDLMMYKEMILMLSPLALQAVPANVMAALRSLSISLAQTMASAFVSLPPAFLHVKLRSARAFSALIGRLLRVNDIANAAAKILANATERRQMLSDWLSFVDAKTLVLREAPCGGAHVYRILTTDVATLLAVPDEPAKDDHAPSDGMTDLAAEASPTFNRTRQSRLASSPAPPDSEPSDPVSEGVIEQWARYLTQLPFQFPAINARVFLLYMNAVLTAALREITLNGGEAFGAWWMVRCWIDEWMSWLAEQGGFVTSDVASLSPGRGESNEGI
ncbi:RFX DNA-binding domain-containing protein [Lipomyces arxii]|uniref:RFX DNA-binding domain-containing protein n=1 Tax=Lipomyces arxii TaxID=56418 RepID=UPI0034CDAF48